MPRSRSQSGDRGSATLTFVSGTSPVFVTVILKVAVPSNAIVCELGSFTIEIAGWVTVATAGGTNGAVTVTGAESVAVTSAPLGGVPVATATFVRFAVTFASVQV